MAGAAELSPESCIISHTETNVSDNNARSPLEADRSWAIAQNFLSYLSYTEVHRDRQRQAPHFRLVNKMKASHEAAQKNKTFVFIC